MNRRTTLALACVLAACDRTPAREGTTTASATPPAADAGAPPPAPRKTASAEPTASPYQPPPEPAATTPPRTGIGTFEDWVRAYEGSGAVERARPPQLRLARDLALKAGRLTFERSGDVLTFDLAGGVETQLTRNAQRNDAPRFFHDGRRIAFFSNRDGMAWRVFAMNADGSDPRPLTGKIREHYGMSFVLSPDDRRLAYITGTGSPDTERAVEVHVVDLATGRDERVGEAGNLLRHPAFSASGAELYYVGGSFDAERLFVADLATRRARELPSAGHEMVNGPTMLGDRLLFTASGSGAFCCQLSRLFTTAPDGTGLRVLGTFSVPGGIYPVVSPDASRIAAAYSYREGGFGADWRVDIAVMGSDGAGARSLAAAFPRPFYSAVNPAWAPDSRHVAFTLSICPYAGCKPNIRSVVVVDATVPGAVPAFIAYGGSPSWSPSPRAP